MNKLLNDILACVMLPHQLSHEKLISECNRAVTLIQEALNRESRPSLTPSEGLAINHIILYCEQWGYGRVMQIAADAWKAKDPIGALTVGPCVGMLKPSPKEESLPKCSGREIEKAKQCILDYISKTAGDDCECGFDEPMGEGYTGGTCYLHQAIEHIASAIGKPSPIKSDSARPSAESEIFEQVTKLKQALNHVIDEKDLWKLEPDYLFYGAYDAASDLIQMLRNARTDSSLRNGEKP